MAFVFICLSVQNFSTDKARRCASYWPLVLFIFEVLCVKRFIIIILSVNISTLPYFVWKFASLMCFVWIFGYQNKFCEVLHHYFVSSVWYFFRHLSQLNWCFEAVYKCSYSWNLFSEGFHRYLTLCLNHNGLFLYSQ